MTDPRAEGDSVQDPRRAASSQPRAARGTRTSDYEYHLPEHLVAQHPADRRDASRLLKLDRETGEVTHGTFPDIIDLVPAGDILVMNRTRVIPARLRGRKPTGGEAEVLLVNPEGDSDLRWRALVRPGRRLRAGQRVEIADELAVEIEAEHEDGSRTVRLITHLPLAEALDRHGSVPLPPYVEREATAADRERYQTVYASERGSVAAPTAGLHFTPEILKALEEKGVRTAWLTLHVGPGTFRPVEVEDPAGHAMHSEWYHLPDETAAEINRIRAGGGSLWAVGTTTVRVLESVADEDGTLAGASGWTDIFIHPPYRYRAVDHLLTNFHLPRSTLMMLVAAFAGYEETMAAYRAAVEEGYRFYSFGDAMVIV